MVDHNQPVMGKTYSLFGDHVSTSFFYEKIASLTDQILKEEQLNPLQFLDYIQKVNQNRSGIRRNVRRSTQEPLLARLLILLHDSFREYTVGIEAHLRSTPIYKIITDRELCTISEQYYLYMIEFGLVNRIHKEEFLKANYRIALLPYCLRETQTGCKAEPDHLDYKCKGCLKGCYINHVSSLLRKHQVEPYIWRTAKLKPLLKGLVQEHGRTGVLGIACMVELVMGMRKCMKAQLPVVGIPLNANRCPRWMDRLHETSVDLNALEELLTPEE